jgi:hypothetical protein
MSLHSASPRLTARVTQHQKCYGADTGGSGSDPLVKTFLATLRGWSGWASTVIHGPRYKPDYRDGPCYTLCWAVLRTGLSGPAPLESTVGFIYRTLRVEYLFILY